jgi:hypothetical protein
VDAIRLRWWIHHRTGTLRNPEFVQQVLGNRYPTPIVAVEGATRVKQARCAAVNGSILIQGIMAFSHRRSRGASLKIRCHGGAVFAELTSWQFIFWDRSRRALRMQKRKAPGKRTGASLQLNQFVPYLTGSPPSRHGCRYRQEVDCPYSKTICANFQMRFSIPEIDKTNRNPAPVRGSRDNWGLVTGGVSSGAMEVPALTLLERHAEEFRLRYAGGMLRLRPAMKIAIY